MDFFARKFLEEDEYRRLFEDYQQSPTDDKKESLQVAFNEFCLRIKTLSYFSKTLPLFAQNFDKKSRDISNTMTLTLDDSEGSVRLQNVSDDTDIHNELSFDTELVENYFENERLYEVISKLTTNQKRIIYLFYVKNKADKEIAQLLNVSVQTINKQRNAILNKIKKEVFSVGH